ncbi:MAG: hypothetical protein ACRYFA_05650 [Janthinobacterium lividum]
MKKDKQKNRKAISKEIKLSLIAKLKEVIATMAPGSQKLEKELKKPLNKLAKKVSKELEVAEKSSVKVDKKQEIKPVAELQKTKNEPKPNLPSSTNSNIAKGKTNAQSIKPKPVKQ